MDPQAEREAQSAAIELARWQGAMDERMNTGDRRFREIGDAIDRIETSQRETAVELATVKTRVAFFGALGGMAGSVVVGVIVAIGSKAFG